MKIKFLDFEREYDLLGREVESLTSSIIKKGSFILGSELKEFEEQFASYCGVKYAVGVNSGTDALYLSLLSLGIKEGDEVIVPAFTYIATAMAVSYTGAKPIFCDIDEIDFNIDIEDIKRKLTPRTKAIIPVHLYGQPANMSAILDFASENNIRVVEDAAQAHGGAISVKGDLRKVGSLSDLGCFSFYPTKNLGCYGDGGIAVTGSDILYEKLLKLRDYGRESKYSHLMLGYNSRLDTLQAAVLSIKLKYLDQWNDRRRELGHYYNEALKGVTEVITPFEKDGLKHVYHVYVLRVKEREKLIEHLSSNGIPSIIHYPIPCHLQRVYKSSINSRGLAPVSERLSHEVLSLPLNPFLGEAEIDYIVSKIKDFY
ncbi:MAG: DegT/DnrJ/EryC1/StrS family aminotransferase [Candidatus Kaelpia aquatica]|nr:DegT/DnrJ/EryC1/StrS family aminotransferase [Candidatus Kaelpia aquatica]